MKINIKHYLKLLRPEISIMDITLPLSSVILALNYSIYNYISFHTLLYLLLLVIGSFFAITSSYVFNDCLDIDVDIINLPDRPLPSGIINKKRAIIYGFILITIAFIISYYFNIQTFFILLISFSIITCYSYYIKRVSPLSFLLVGLSYGLVPVGIWTSINPFNFYFLENTIDLFYAPIPCIIFFIMICITDFSFSLSGVCRDIIGDKNRNILTFPVIYGISITSKIIFLFWLIGTIFLVLLHLYSKFNIFNLIIIICSSIWILNKCYMFIKDATPKNGNKLFLRGSLYRSIIFISIIINILLKIIII